MRHLVKLLLPTAYTISITEVFCWKFQSNCPLDRDVHAGDICSSSSSPLPTLSVSHSQRSFAGCSKSKRLLDHQEVHAGDICSSSSSPLPKLSVSQRSFAGSCSQSVCLTVTFTLETFAQVPAPHCLNYQYHRGLLLDVPNQSVCWIIRRFTLETRCRVPALLPGSRHHPPAGSC